MRRKSIVALALAVTMTISMSMTAYAGSWEQAGTNWKYADNGTYMTGWQWIDGKSYYFDGNGIMAKSTVIDGYELNANGQWIVNGEVQTRTDAGVVQTQENKSENTSVNHSANYDSAYPLAGKIDEWNLRLPNKYIGGFVIVNDNIQALLTGQMDQYYIPPVGNSINPTTGTQMYVTQEDYDANVKNTQELYEWFCNWLNNINFENMSEMDKAKEIQKILAQGINIDGENSNTRNAQYSVLINKQGMCAEYAMTATSLAKALGLKTAVSGSGIHAVYYIQVDGVGYFGQNNKLVLDYPTPDFVYFQ